MGNEMGNANASGLQEEETGRFEAANKPSEVLVATINESSVNSEKQPVSLPEEEDYHDRHKDLIPVDSSGIDDTITNAILSSKLDVIEEQVSDESFESLLISNDLNDKVNEPLSASEGESREEKQSATDKESAETNGNEEQGTTTIQLASDDIYDEAAQSILSSEDGKLQEIGSASDTNLTKASDFQIQRPISIGAGEKIIISSPSMIPTPLNSDVVVSKDLDSDLRPASINEEIYVDDDGMLQRSDPDALGLTGLPNSDEERKEEDKETENILDGTAPSLCIPEVKRHGHDMHVEGENSHEDMLLGLSMPDGRTSDIKAGADGGETVEPALYIEKEEAQESFKAELDRTEAVLVSASLDSFQVGNSQSEDKFIVLTDETNPFTRSGDEQNKDLLDIVALSESEEESKVDMTKDHNLEPLVIGADHEGDSRLVGVGIVNKDTIITNLQTSEEKEIDSVHHVAFCANTISAREKDLYLEKEEEMLGEISASPTDFTGINTNSMGVEISICTLSLCGSVVEQAVAEEGALQDQDFMKKDAEETEIVKPVSKNGNPIEPDITYFIPSPETQSQDAPKQLTVAETRTLENSRDSNIELEMETFGDVGAGYASNVPASILRDKTSVKGGKLRISTDQSEGKEQTYPSSSSTGHDSNMNLGSPDSNESYNTAYEQDLNSYMDDGRKSSFYFNEQIVETVVTEVLAEFYQHAELSREGGTTIFKQNPVQYEQTDINGNVFRSNRSDTEIDTDKDGVSSESCGAKNTSSKLTEDDGISAEKPSQDQITEEKQIITLVRTNSAKLNTPLISFLEEESYLVGSQQKQEKLVAKKTTEEKWKADDDKITGTVRESGAKRKPRPLFFNICMCCTTEIP